MMDFDYKKYSLEQLENWVHDAVSSAEASPQEIYDVIKGVVEEQYHYHKLQTGRCYELLALLNGNGKGHIPAYDECLEKKENNEDSSSESSMPPWGHSDLEYLVANKNKNKWVLPVDDDYNVTFPEDFLEKTGWKAGDTLEWHDQGDGSFILRKIKQKPFVDPYTDEMISAGYKMIDGVWTLVSTPTYATYDEKIAAGWSMTDDGFWIKEN